MNRHATARRLLYPGRTDPLEKNMASTPRSLTRPAKDEWGVYDPQQAGLAALYARLDMKDTKVTPVVTAANKLIEKPETIIEKPAPAVVRPALRDAK
jgi:hypothetical protein